MPAGSRLCTPTTLIAFHNIVRITIARATPDRHRRAWLHGSRKGKEQRREQRPRTSGHPGKERQMESKESTEMGKGLAKLASALGHSEEESPASAGSGHKKSLLGITDGMEEMSKGFIAMTGGLTDMAGGMHDMAGGLHDLADSFHQLKVAIQPIAKSINHVAAGLTAVGLTLIYANWGVGSFLLGNVVFLSSLAMFHYLLRAF